jgi:hypothetical protein
MLSLYRSGALPEGTRRVRRPAARWLDSVAKRLKRVGVTNWRRKSEDRDKWRAVVKETKAPHGLQRPQKQKNNKKRKRRRRDKLNYIFILLTARL